MTFPFPQVVFGSIVFLLAYYTQRFEEIDKISYLEERSENFALPNVKEYDFIVIGAGPSGSVVANKLSSKYTVLLLEHGGDPIPIMDVPASYPWLHPHPDLTHKWTSVKQTKSALGNDGFGSIVMGKGLGGTTRLNGMIYNRGSPYDYNNWAELTGDDSWNYENLLKYFKRTENFHTTKYDEHLGYDGLLYLSRNEDSLDSTGLKWHEAWKKAGKELGHDNFWNPNAPQVPGFGPLSETKRFGHRYSAYEAFLKPILQRDSLKIERYSEAKKIDFDENKKAIGIHYLRHGINEYAKARKEIILSAGTLNSPLILMRSGIGIQDQLNKAKISVVANLPVGKYFQDHPLVYVENIFPSKSQQPFPSPEPEDIENFIEKGTGPLTNTWGLFGQGFFVSQAARKDPMHKGKDWPDVQLIALHNSSTIVDGDNSMVIIISLGLPKSYGSMKLNTIDPHQSPLIWDPQWLAEDQDLDAMVEARSQNPILTSILVANRGLELLDKVVNSQSFKEAGIRQVKTPLEACKSFEFGSTDYWRCFAKQRTQTHWHAVGTCRMGKIDDSESVVDTKLRVKGVKGLRVVDNSIQPFLTNANTMAPAYVIGQKGAEMIMREYIGH